MEALKHVERRWRPPNLRKVILPLDRNPFGHRPSLRNPPSEMSYINWILTRTGATGVGIETCQTRCRANHGDKCPVRGTREVKEWEEMVVVQWFKRFLLSGFLSTLALLSFPYLPSTFPSNFPYLKYRKSKYGPLKEWRQPNCGWIVYCYDSTKD
jgi:hypothetical protein